MVASRSVWAVYGDRRHDRGPADPTKLRRSTMGSRARAGWPRCCRPGLARCPLSWRHRGCGTRPAGRRLDAGAQRHVRRDPRAALTPKDRKVGQTAGLKRPSVSLRVGPWARSRGSSLGCRRRRRTFGMRAVPWRTSSQVNLSCLSRSCLISEASLPSMQRGCAGYSRLP